MTLRKTVKADNRVNASSIYTTDGATRGAMEIADDEESRAIIVQLLTDLYEKPVEGTVREVISNAIDATVAAGSSLPVKVSLPTILRSSFVVEDFGTGMSLDTVRYIFSSVGRSTKRKDFSQIGAYGLGTKAPLAYCSEYTVQTTHDGMTTLFTLGRSERGNEFNILSHEFTGLDNGTKVTIPARMDDVAEFRESVKKYRNFSVDTKIMVDGELLDSSEQLIFLGEVVLDPESNTTGRVWIRHAVDMRSGFSGYNSGSRVENLIDSCFLDFQSSRQPQSDSNVSITYSLSGWPYKSPVSEGNRYRYNPIELVVELKPGIVDFTTSRDSITLNDRSSGLYAKVIEDLKSDPQKIMDRIMEYYRGLEGDRLAFFTSFLVLRAPLPAIFEKPLTSWVYGGIEFNLEDFTTNNGTNLLRDLHPAFNDFKFDAMAALRISGEGHKNYSAGDVMKGKIFASALSRNKGAYFSCISDTNNFVREMIEENNYGLSIAGAMGELWIESVKGAINSAGGVANNYKGLVITGVNSDNVDSVIRSRLALIRNGYEKSYVFLTGLSKDDIDLSAYSKYFTVDFMTVEELKQWVKSTRKKKVVKAKSAASVLLPVYEFDYSTPADLNNPITSSSLSKMAKSVTLDEILKKGHIYLGPVNSFCFTQTVYGAINSGIGLRKIFLINPATSWISAAQYEEILGSGKVIASKVFSYNSIAAKTIAEKHSYRAEYLTSRYQDIPLELLKQEYNFGFARIQYAEDISRMPGILENVKGFLKRSSVSVEEKKDWNDILGDSVRIREALKLRDNEFLEKAETFVKYVDTVSGFGGNSSKDVEETIIGSFFGPFSQFRKTPDWTHPALENAVSVVVQRMNAIWN